MKNLIVIFSSGISILIASCGRDGYYIAQDSWRWGPMMHYEYMGGPFMWIILLFVAGLLIYFIIQTTKRESALDILKKRYAKGEINKDDFDRMKEDLESS